MQTADITVTVTRFGGTDNAVVVFVDTTFEPDASDHGPGLRVLINDDLPYEGVAHESRADSDSRPSTSYTLSVDFADSP